MLQASLVANIRSETPRNCSDEQSQHGKRNHKSGIPKDHNREPTGHCSQWTRLQWNFLKRASQCTLAYSQSARMETGLLCRTQRILSIDWACTSREPGDTPRTPASSQLQHQMPDTKSSGAAGKASTLIKVAGLIWAMLNDSCHYFQYCRQI